MGESKKISLCCKNRRCPEAIIAGDTVFIRGTTKDFVFLVEDNKIGLMLTREQVERIHKELTS